MPTWRRHRERAGERRSAGNGRKPSEGDQTPCKHAGASAAVGGSRPPPVVPVTASWGSRRTQSLVTRRLQVERILTERGRRPALPCPYAACPPCWGSLYSCSLTLCCLV